MTKENESTAYSCKYVNNQESTELLGYDCINEKRDIIYENAKGLNSVCLCSQLFLTFSIIFVIWPKI